MASPRARHRWLLGIVALAALLAGGVALQRWRADVAWSAMLARADRLQAELEAGDGRRGVLWGEERPDNACDDYRRAAAALERTGFVTGWADYIRLRYEGDGAAVPALRAELVGDGGAVLAHLRAGAHRACSDRRHRWRAPQSMSVLAPIRIVQLAVLAAWQAAERGDTAGAAHHVLDAMQLGRDFMQSPLGFEASMGQSAMAHVTEAGLAVDLLTHLDRPAWQTLARGMAQVDDAVGDLGPCPDGDLLTWTRLIASPPGEIAWREWCLGSETRLTMRAWRFGFASRLMLADAIEASALLCDRLRATADLSWTERRDSILALHRSLMQSNPLVQLWFPHHYLSRTFAQARLRVGRAVVTYLLTGRVPGLTDPFGGVVQHRRLGATMKIWAQAPRGRAVALVGPRAD